MSPPESPTLGRYVLGPLLGSGGMGDVYRAEDTRLQRPVALKVLRARDAWRGGSPPPDAVARLLREARAAAALHHPNAVQIYDVGEEAGRAYLAMELVVGTSLRDAVGDEAIPLATRVRWLAEVASALAAAHRIGLVHRDVKPENVMIREDGTAKVLDFGIARRWEPATDPARGDGPMLPTISAEGLSVGTPLYMSPEQLRGERADPRSDQFAWGVVAYELLTGRSPWTDGSETAIAVVGRILEATPEVAMGPEHRSIEPIVRRAMAKEAEARFGSMDDVVEQLALAAPRDAGALRSTRARVLWPLVALSLTAALATTVPLVRRHRAARADTTTASRPNQRMAELRTSPSRVPEAEAAYLAGIQSVRDAARSAARVSFARATELDPSFAAAHLRYVLVSEASAVAREHFRSATAARAQLSPDGAALLAASEPLMRESPDPREAMRRLAELAARSPDVSEYAVLLGRIQVAFDKVDEAIPLLERARESDPTFAEVERLLGFAYASVDRPEDADHAFLRCTELAPNATSCLEQVGELQTREGKCREAEQTGRRILNVDPTDAVGFTLIAEGLEGQGAPHDAVRLAFEQRARGLPQGGELAMARADIALATIEGDFTRAANLCGAYQRAIASSGDARLQYWPVERDAVILLEVGRRKEAATVLRDYVRRRSGWAKDPFAADPAFDAYAALFRAGAIDETEWKRRRAESIAAETARAPSDRGALWVAAYAKNVTDEASAREALAALPEFGALPNARSRDLAADDAIGWTYFLAGRVDDALPFLRRAAGSCRGLSLPVEQQHARLHLARALESHGDPSAACAEYAAILSAWRPSSPTSETVIAAHHRQREACSRP